MSFPQSIAALDIKNTIESLLLVNFSRLTGAAMSGWRRSFFGEAEAQKNVMLACQPRGGSTWLAESLLTMDDYEMIWEPFNPQWNGHVKQYGFKWHNYFPGTTLPQPAQAFARELLKGRHVAVGHMGPSGSLCRIVNLAASPHLLFKCTNACMMLHQLHTTFPLKTVLFVRHPCAVVASQLSHGGWNEVEPANPDLSSDVDTVLTDYPQWRHVWEDCSTQEEALAFLWGVRTAVPLSQPEMRNWHLITYEQLVTAPQKQIEALFAYLDRDVPSDIYRQLNRPSMMVRDDSNVAKNRDPLRTWTRRLSSDQAERILHVVHRMGISLYDAGFHPHLDALNSEGSMSRPTGSTSSIGSLGETGSE